MDWASTDPHIQRYVQKTSTTGEETAPDVKEWRYWQSFCQRASSHSPHSKVVYIWKKSHYTSTFWQSCWMSFLRCKYMLTQKKFRSQLLFMFWKSLGKVSWEKKLLLFWILSKLTPSPPPSPPSHLGKLYNFCWGSKTSILETFKMTHYPLLLK